MRFHIVATLTAAALLVSAACGARAEGPPPIEVDRSACAHCGMLISEPVYAAASRASGGEATLFDDIACMLAARRGSAGVQQAWVHDTPSGAWIDAVEALFVKSDQLRTPMGGGVIAFRERGAAEHAAARHNGRLMASWTELLSHDGKERGGQR